MKTDNVEVQKKTESKVPMESKDVVDIIKLLEAEGVAVWLDGGWGVDALLEKQTRPHKDVDVIVQGEDVEKMQSALRRKSFRVVEGKSPKSFVFRDKKGREIDVHPVRFDEQGNGLYLMQNGEDWVYPAEGFTGKGRVGGRVVRCLTAKTQIAMSYGL